MIDTSKEVLRATAHPAVTEMKHLVAEIEKHLAVVARSTDAHDLTIRFARAHILGLTDQLDELAGEVGRGPIIPHRVYA